MRLLSILTLLLLGAAGCNLANVAQGPTEVMLLFTYPVDQIPDQVNLELKDADGEVLAEIAVPQMPKVFLERARIGGSQNERRMVGAWPAHL